MRRRDSYNQVYRGRQESSAFLRALVIILAILLALGIAFLILMTSRYLQYTDDGPVLNLPWLSEDPEISVLPDPSDFIIEETPAPSPTPSAAPAWQTQRAVTAPVSAVTDGSAQALAAGAGASCLVVPVQDEEGNLAWHTDLALALEDMNGDPAFNEAVRALSSAEGITLTAKLSGFRDLWSSVYGKSAALVTPANKMWYDSGGISWLSAADRTAQNYLTSLCLELADLGFDEILLEHAGFPDAGRVNYIDEGERYPADKGAVVAAYLADLGQKLSEAGAVLSVCAPEAGASSEALSGVTPAALATVTGRVWLPGWADTAVWINALEQAGFVDSAQRLVAAEPLSDGGWSGSRWMEE